MSYGFNNNFNGYQPNYQQTYQPTYQQRFAPQPISNIEYVSGLEGVKAMPLPPNATKFVMDSEQKIFYIKKTDAEGRPYIKAYPYIDEEEQPKVEFATIQQVAELKQEIDQLKCLLEGKNG